MLFADSVARAGHQASKQCSFRWTLHAHCRQEERKLTVNPTWVERNLGCDPLKTPAPATTDAYARAQSGKPRGEVRRRWFVRSRGLHESGHGLRPANPNAIRSAAAGAWARSGAPPSEGPVLSGTSSGAGRGTSSYTAAIEGAMRTTERGPNPESAADTPEICPRNRR